MALHDCGNLVGWRKDRLSRSAEALLGALSDISHADGELLARRRITPKPIDFTDPMVRMTIAPCKKSSAIQLCVAVAMRRLLESERIGGRLTGGREGLSRGIEKAGVLELDRVLACASAQCSLLSVGQPEGNLIDERNGWQTLKYGISSAVRVGSTSIANTVEPQPHMYSHTRIAALPSPRTSEARASISKHPDP